MDPLLLGLTVVFGVPAAALLYVWLIEQILIRLPDKFSRRVRPWLWLLPALVLLIAYLIYPTIYTLYLSFRNASGNEFIGLRNYLSSLSNPAILTAFRNNLIWFIVFPTITLVLALLIAVLADRVRYENLVKTIVLIPMAISSVAAGVIWKLMYDYQPAFRAQTGALNALLTFIVPDADPVRWLNRFPINNIALIFIAVWMFTGFATAILSAALKRIPVEIFEAARIDGAGVWNTFRHITLPLLEPTIAVVATTLMVSALKIFDIVYVMTNGNFGSEVITNRIFKELFTFHNQGRASAIATLLLLLTIPVMVYNIRRFRAQEEQR